MSNPNFLKSKRNYRGGINAARLQALKDISQHQALTEITHLNRQLGL